jgi:hypothetical protein
MMAVNRRVRINTQLASQLDGKVGYVADPPVANGFIRVVILGYCAPICFSPKEVEAV